MINHEFLADKTLLVVRPTDRLAKEDFAALAAVVDPVIEEHGELRGLMIEAPTFPGWQNFGSFVTHMRFVRDHHKDIEKVALVSDSNIASIVPSLAKHFVAADVRHFPAAKREDALTWLAG
jgi:hypothetical protein